MTTLYKFVLCRYSAKGLPNYPTCQHRVGYQCCLLSMHDIKCFHDSFYLLPEKGKQDSFILKYCHAQTPNPKRKKKEDLKKPKSMTFEYTIVNAAGVNLSVCRNTFLNVLNITKHRVIGVFKRFKKGANLVPVETRGGDQRSKQYDSRRKAVIDFISSFKANESHYGRGKSTKVYLPSELNVNKMWRMYLLAHTDELQVTKSFFRKVFCTSFNISFSSPAVDECSTCLSLQHNLTIEKNEDKRTELQLKLQCHKREAKFFLIT